MPKNLHQLKINNTRFLNKIVKISKIEFILHLIFKWNFQNPANDLKIPFLIDPV